MSINKFQIAYDAVVVGFGGAGATAARFAADNGLTVLLLDAAPLGHEGGNTRYCAQDAGYSTDYQKTLKYYEQLTYPIKESHKVLEAFVRGLASLPNYYRKYLGVKPVRTDDKPQFPEFRGNEAYQQQDIHHGNFDAALWKLLRSKVLARKDKIDVWLNSRAEHLVQDPNSQKIIGVIVERKNKEIKVLARKGVIMTCGGFENNTEMKQAFLGTRTVKPVGTVYNRGDGLRMTQEVGAKLWHMWNFETLGFLHGLSFLDKEAKRAHLDFGDSDLYQGSIFAVAGDGTRYFREDEANRHGHLYDHGTWRIPNMPEKPYLIMDQDQYDKLAAKKFFAGRNLEIKKADKIGDLAQKIGFTPQKLEKEVECFNYFAKRGNDYEYHRDPKTMRPLVTAPFYAIALEYNILNTQGGPVRDEHGQILGLDNKPIPHLFGAGELGGICANLYQGGANVAECLIYGKISADSLSRVNDPVKIPVKNVIKRINDITAAEKSGANFTAGHDQFLGTSSAGIGGKMTVRVTYKDKHIRKIEVLENHESEDVGLKALRILPAKMVKNNSVDVDAISGASATSRALKSAVNDALTKAKKG